MSRITVRPFQVQDAAGVAELYNRYGYGPITHGYPLTAEDIQRAMVERGKIRFVVAVNENGRVVGTMSFHPVSGQKAASPGAVWGGKFFIHPEYRLGQIPAQLFTKGIEYLVERGYNRIDTEVAPGNLTAISLYKRVGFRRTYRSIIDGDDYLEMINYTPYLARYFQQALNLKENTYLDKNVAQGWKNLLSTLAARSSEVDSIYWHGREVVSYDLEIEQARIQCLIDLECEQIIALYSNIFSFECYPHADRWQAGAGEEVTLCFRYINTSQTDFRLAVRQCWPDGREVALLEGMLLEPGASWEKELSVVLPESGGPLVLENRLLLEEIWPGQTNRFYFTFALPLKTVAGAAAGGGRGQKVVECWNTSGQVRVSMDERQWCLENAAIKVRLDARTGALEVVERTTGKVMVQEPWPDLGPPFPGGFKRPAERPLRLVEWQESAGRSELVLESPANIWWWRDKASLSAMQPPGGEMLCGYTLRRRYVLGTDGTLLIGSELHKKHFDTAAGERDSAGASQSREFFLRLYPWASQRLLDLTVPLKSGLCRLPVIYEKFPFLTHDYEGMRSGDLPLSPDDYTAPWSAFSGEGMVVGLIWPGAHEVRFGLHWMPSVLYRVMLPLSGEMHRFPNYYYFCGAGDYRQVARCWQMMNKSCLPGAEQPVVLSWPPVVAQVKPALFLAGEKKEVTVKIRTTSQKPREGEVFLILPAEAAAGGALAGEKIAADRAVGDIPGNREFGKPEKLRSWDKLKQICRQWLVRWKERGKQGANRDAGSTGSKQPKRQVRLYRGGISWSKPCEVTYPVCWNGSPGIWQGALMWQEKEGQVVWPWPVLVPGSARGEVQVKQLSQQWRVSNGRLQFTLAPHFAGTLIGLQAGARQWLYTGYPKIKPIGSCPASRGGAKFYPVTGSDDWLVTLSAEEVPWQFVAQAYASPGNALPWRGVQLTGKTEQEEWKQLEVCFFFLTLPDSPLLWAVAQYHYRGEQERQFDSVFSLHANPAAGQRFCCLRGEEVLTVVSGEEKVSAVLGESVGVLETAEGTLALVTCGQPGKVLGRQLAGGLWQLMAMQRLKLSPGSSRSVAVGLMLGPVNASPRLYRHLAAVLPEGV
ncbi:MAG: GNAT family N-acetyltransferase [Desulfurispora sp.]|uniref:GNAT family N-acetyltransferase n=1 Tax=Desulfurispora sp. TaxID=3014275 RepID=UPI00404B02C5